MEQQRRGQRSNHVNRPAYGFPSVSARLEMQQRSHRAHNQVVGTKLRHDGSLGYITRGRGVHFGGGHNRAARRAATSLKRTVALVAAVVVLVGALAWVGYLTTTGAFDHMFSSPQVAATADGRIAERIGSKASGAGSKAYTTAVLDQDKQAGSGDASADGTADASAGAGTASTNG